MISGLIIVILVLLLMLHAIIATFAKMFIFYDLHIKFFNYTKANWKYFKYFVAIPGVPFIYMAIFFAITVKNGIKDAWSEFSRE
jgi:ribose/xylose/arabinose/galactoside ABC-type transport system permease subunit